jgi:hypothetical protein
MTMLEPSNVSKRDGDLTALEPVDLLLIPAKTYVLLGQSAGCKERSPFGQIVFR